MALSQGLPFPTPLVLVFDECGPHPHPPLPHPHLAAQYRRHPSVCSVETDQWNQAFKTGRLLVAWFTWTILMLDISVWFIRGAGSTLVSSLPFAQVVFSPLITILRFYFFITPPSVPLGGRGRAGSSILWRWSLLYGVLGESSRSRQMIRSTSGSLATMESPFLCRYLT